MSREPCLPCRELRRLGSSAYDPRRFTLAEWNILLSQTGIAGERHGRPVIAALVLPRVATVRLPKHGPLTIKWEVVAFRCPWSPPERPAIRTTGLYVALREDGFEYPSPRALDESGCFSEFTGCDVEGDEPSYIRPFRDPTLPRRRVAELL